ncbi:hypothetical protein [Rhizorhabdus sp. FW153]|uniref:hypothetical protein n=1 Tax=Rhizorhabdus sp. FW153 TaxID=3400216 RepID=UPI003CEA834E
MGAIIRSLVVAAAPIFAIVALLITRPSLGWVDVAISLGIAFAASYGILIAAIPIHLMLRQFNRTDFASYLLAFLLALVALIAISTIVEGSPPPPMPNDNSPFAEMTLRNGGWIFFIIVGAPIVTVMAWIFWRFAAFPHTDL